MAIENQNRRFALFFLVAVCAVIFISCEKEKNYEQETLFWAGGRFVGSDRDRDYYWANNYLILDFRSYDPITVDIDIFVKPSSEISYRKLQTTENMLIFADSNPMQLALTEENGEELPYGIYDFKVALRHTGTQDIVFSSVNEISAGNYGLDLNGRMLETSQDDNKSAIRVRRLFLSDADQDGYSPIFRFDLVFFGTAIESVRKYVKVYDRAGNSGSYNFYHKSSAFDVSNYWVVIGSPWPELSHGLYDLKFEVYDAAEDTILAVAEPDTLSDIWNIPFETLQEDGL